MLFFVIQFILDGITREQFRVAYRAALGEAHGTDRISDKTRCYRIKDTKNFSQLVLRSRPATIYAQHRVALEARHVTRAARLLIKDSDDHKSTAETDLLEIQASVFQATGLEPGAKLHQTEEDFALACIDFSSKSIKNMEASIRSGSHRRYREASIDLGPLKGEGRKAVEALREEFGPAWTRQELYREWKKTAISDETDCTAEPAPEYVEPSTQLQLMMVAAFLFTVCGALLNMGGAEELKHLYKQVCVRADEQMGGCMIFNGDMVTWTAEEKVVLP